MSPDMPYNPRFRLPLWRCKARRARPQEGATLSSSPSSPKRHQGHQSRPEAEYNLGQDFVNPAGPRASA